MLAKFAISMLYKVNILTSVKQNAALVNINYYQIQENNKNYNEPVIRSVINDLIHPTLDVRRFSNLS